MAENPVLKEAKRIGAATPVSTVNKNEASAATLSGSANPVLREYYGLKAQERKESQQQIASAARLAMPESTQEENATFGSRVKNTFSGWKDRQASNLAGAAESWLEIARLGDKNISLQNRQASQAEKNAAHYKEMLERGTWDDGNTITADERKWLEERVADSIADAGAYRSAVERTHEPISNVISKVEAYGDEKKAASEEALAQAKKGASKLGQIAVDAGTVAGDVAAYALLNAAMPGLGTTVRVANMYGQGAEAAEDKGFGLGKQFLYGAGTAGMGEATNRLFNNNPILQKAFGQGALDDILLPGLNATKAGLIVKGGLGEALEEGFENVGDKGLQAILFGDQRDKLDWNDVGYDALLAAIIGSSTSAISASPRNTAKGSSATQINANEGSNAPEINVAQNASKSDSRGKYTDADYKRDLANLETAKQTLADAEARNASVLEIEFAKAAVEDAESKLKFVNANDGLGAANAGFTTPDSVSQEKTSRVADTTLGFNKVEREASGLDAEQYAQLMKYKTLTEKMATQQADDMLYVQQNGQKTFLKDVDETAYKDITDWLKMAPAWDAPMVDAAYMIRNELKGKSVNGEITQEEYADWLKTIKEHSTSGGQGVQAQAKWSRTDNNGGASTELEAMNALKESKLPKEEQARIFRQIVQWDTEIEAVPVGDTATMKDIVMRVANERGVVNGLFGKAFARLAESSLDTLTFDQLKQFAYSSTSALAHDSTPADAGRKLKTVQILNMLSKPTTSTKNITGNTTFYGIDALAMNGASILDMAVSALTGTRSIAAEKLPNLSAAAKAMQMAIAEITLDIDMGGEKTRYGTGSGRTFKMKGTGAFNTNTSVDKFVERVVSTLERNEAYLMTATDEFYKGAAKATEAGTQALIDSGKIKTKDKEYAAKQAKELAEYRTFQDKSKLSVAIQQIHDVLNVVAGVGDSGKVIGGRTVHAFGAGDIVAPFTKVAGNLVSRGLDYSPLNAAKGVLEITRQVVAATNGQEVDVAKQAKGVSNLARGMTGTAIAYGFMQLVQAGLMRQAEDENDKDVAALNQSEGMRGTQINLSALERAVNGGTAEWQYGDTLVDLSSIEPLNLLMNLGAEMAKTPQNPLVSSFKSTVDSFGAAATELPVLQGVGNFAKDVFKYGKDWKESAMEQAANTVISSVVPNIVSGIAQGLDDRPRNIYTGDDLWDYIEDSLKNKIPGQRETLPGSVNSLGEDKTYQGSQDSLIAALFSPVGINAYTQSDVSKEMERVREETGGDVSFYPESTIPGKLSYENKEIKLTYDQRQKFQKVRGQTQTAITEQMKASSAYKSASAKEQAALLNRCKDYATQTARKFLLGADAVESWVKNADNARADVKMSPVEYMALYEKYGHNYLTGEAYEKTKAAAQAGFSVERYINARHGMNANKDGYLSKEEATNKLRADGFTPQEIRTLLPIINKTW